MARPRKLLPRRDKRSIKEQLKGGDCSHKNVNIETNSKKKQFKECDDCGAFLGFK